MDINDSVHNHRTAIEGTKILRDIISDEIGNIIGLVNYMVLSALIAFSGILTNVINMMVFYRQGFNTTTNISFFAMAISDMICLIASEWYVICYNLHYAETDVPFIPKEIQYLSAAISHACFGRITGWITVFITAERCLGVAMPIRVKQIITVRRTTFAMCLIFIVNLMTILPEHVIYYWDWRFVPVKNRTLLGMAYRSYMGQVYGLAYILVSSSGFICFIFIILLTTLLVVKLARTSKWRKKATGKSDNSETVSSRDKKTMKMIIMIATVLIVCYIPGTVITLASTFVPEFMIGHALSNSYFAFWSIAFVFNILNSSINVFFYYGMSTKYRQTFRELFSRCIKQRDDSIKQRDDSIKQRDDCIEQRDDCNVEHPFNTDSTLASNTYNLNVHVHTVHAIYCGMTVN